MFNVGDMVEFWLPDGKKYRYGKIVRKDKTTCFIWSDMLKNRRIYKIKQKYLMQFRGEEYARTKNR